MIETVRIAFDSSPRLFCVVALTSWVVACTVQRSVSRASFRRLLHPIRLLTAWGFWTSALVLVSRSIETTGTWPEWLLGLSAAAASEVVLFCYSESYGCSNPIWLNTLSLLRVAAIGLVAMVLLEPVVTREEQHESDRFIALLIDASHSMSLDTRVGHAESRRDIAQRILAGQRGDNAGLLSALQQGYQLRVYEFGTSAHVVPPEHWTRATALESGPWSQSTDMATALRQVASDIPMDDLSGVILLTDGCDHSESDLEQASRVLAVHDVPINSVVIGSQDPVRDAEIVSIDSPGRVMLGDSIALAANVKADLYEGHTATIRLEEDGHTIEEKPLRIDSDRLRQTVSFRHQPDAVGIHHYTVTLDGLPNDETVANNTAHNHVVVSKDYVRLLIVDDRPRWEFRYLRNLFAGRDRTVFLQSVLLRPDRLAGVPAPPRLHASTLRAFDDCEATALPRDESEWLKFDVIVLGDVSPASLGEAGIETLRRFVKERGGTLIVISGQGYMPHAYSRSPLAEILPVKFGSSNIPSGNSPDNRYFLLPAAENSALTQELATLFAMQPELAPELTWRHPVSQAKVGATVVAYASSEIPEGPAGAITDRGDQRRRALVLWQRFGAGKVLQLTFDQTWRLRYGVGDKWHHKFWGQVVRWAAKDRLNAGTDLVRMATDRSLYCAGESMKILARVLDANRNPVVNDDVHAVVYRDGDVIHQTNLVPRPDASGMLHATLDAPDQPGSYRVKLTGACVERALNLEQRDEEEVCSHFVVDNCPESLESGDVVADSTVPRQLAGQTGGTVTTPDNSRAILQTLGPESTFTRDRWTVPLWNLWPVITAFLSCLCIEWITRKSLGLV